MARTMLLFRYGFCTCLGLAVIGLAAVSPDPTPDASTPTGFPPETERF